MGARTRRARAIRAGWSGDRCHRKFLQCSSRGGGARIKFRKLHEEQHAVVDDLNLAARFADQLIVLHRGKVQMAGRPSAVLTPGMLAEVFEVEAELTAATQTPSVVVPIRAMPVEGAAAANSLSARGVKER